MTCTYPSTHSDHSAPAHATYSSSLRRRSGWGLSPVTSDSRPPCSIFVTPVTSPPTMPRRDLPRRGRRPTIRVHGGAHARGKSSDFHGPQIVLHHRRTRPHLPGVLRAVPRPHEPDGRADEGDVRLHADAAE